MNRSMNRSVIAVKELDWITGRGVVTVLRVIQGKEERRNKWLRPLKSLKSSVLLFQKFKQELVPNEYPKDDRRDQGTDFHTRTGVGRSGKGGDSTIRGEEAGTAPTPAV